MCLKPITWISSCAIRADSPPTWVALVKPPPQLALVAERKIVMLSVPGWVSPQYHVVDVSAEPDGVMTTVCEGDETEGDRIGNPFCPIPAPLQVLVAAWIFELIVGSELVTRTRAPQGRRLGIQPLCTGARTHEADAEASSPSTNGVKGSAGGATVVSVPQAAAKQSAAATAILRIRNSVVLG